MMTSGSRLVAFQNARATVFTLERPGDADETSSWSINHESELAAISLMAGGSRLVTLDQVGSRGTRSRGGVGEI